jgi:cytochrome oxidase Cu insertion factor (SCO1/SenC/PrrC family)
LFFSFHLVALAIYTSSSSFSGGTLFMAAQIKVGEKAPDFTLPDVDLKQISLKDFLGQKIVLAFFIGAFTKLALKIWSFEMQCLD